MADSASREEKVQAGLRKLKQFQQSRASKPVKKRIIVDKDDSSSSSDVSPNVKDKPAKFEAKDSKKVPSQLTENISAPENSNKDQLKERACTSEVQSPASETPFANVELVPKSKSDLDLTAIRELSSTESLRQISRQVNGLMAESHAFLNGSVDQEDKSEGESQSLEKRNQELASLVNQYRQSNDHREFQLQELKAKNNRKLREFEREKQELQEKAHKEQVSLKDQLQVHIQTIGILVAEKTELQSSLSLSQQSAKQKAGEVEELQGRLRASRQRSSDIEKDLIGRNNSTHQLEKANKDLNKDVERLKLENYKLSKTNEETWQLNTELSEKLSKKISEMKSLENEISVCNTKLSESNVQLQQLSQSNNPEQPSQLEELHLEKLELEKRNILQKEAIDKLINERDRMFEQYQEYIQQLSQQVTSLRDEVKHMSSEKESILKHKNILQEKLEQLQNSMGDSSKENTSELKIQLSVLENQNVELRNELDVQNQSKIAMTEVMQKQEDNINELKKTVARLQEDQVDNNKLANAIQSEKVAASRAVAQNIELKKQLAELQNGFVDMSNDKLIFAEKLHSEQHITKELGERLSQQEEELHELRDQLSQKENQLLDLEKSNTKGIYQQNQIADRMRHYEAQGQLAEMLQKELQQARERMSALVKQNSDLRMTIATQAEVTVCNGNPNDKDASKQNDLVASLSASVCQLEMERDQMMKQLEEQKIKRTNLEEQMKKKEVQINADNDVVSKEEYAVMKSAMEQLEEKFKQTMSKIAELSDERQQLEHLVTQLQGETDTIGDYIALYQIQRGLMRKRASEKDDYIAQLAMDREDLKTKLGELENLVMRLLEERKRYSPEKHLIEQDADVQTSIRKHKLDSQHVNDIESDTSKEAFFSQVYPDKGSEEKTAKKIIDLLNDIGTTNLVEKTVLDNFHPCPVCSGRLITV